MFVFQSQSMVLTLERSLQELQTEHDALKLQQQKVRNRVKLGFLHPRVLSKNTFYNIYYSATA